MQAFCVKCKEKRDVQEAYLAEIIGKGGKPRPMLKGKCGVCKTTMVKIMSVVQADEWKKSQQSGQQAA